jgi:hypothetical protein
VYYQRTQCFSATSEHSSARLHLITLTASSARLRGPGAERPRFAEAFGSPFPARLRLGEVPWSCARRFSSSLWRDRCGCKARSGRRGSSSGRAGRPPGRRLAFALLSPHAGIPSPRGPILCRAVGGTTPSGSISSGDGRGIGLPAPDARQHPIAGLDGPRGFVTGFGMPASDLMRLRLENAADPNQRTEAGPFTIVAPR